MSAQKKRTEQLYCCVCRSIIPEDRVLKEAVTCSKACATKLRNIRRRRHDSKKCRYCNQPSTPAERRDFRKWREAQGTKRKRGRPARSTAPEGQTEFTDHIYIS